MKCCAPVTGHHERKWPGSTESWTSIDGDPKRCRREGTVRISGWHRFFCTQHAPIWAQHYALVERIRAIPNRCIHEAPIGGSAYCYVCNVLHPSLGKPAL